MGQLSREFAPGAEGRWFDPLSGQFKDTKIFTTVASLVTVHQF